jgi:hypothetical protein
VASNLSAGCGEGDWSLVTLSLQQTGSSVTGAVTTRDGLVFPVTGTANGNSGSLNFGVVALPPNDQFCSGGLTFVIKNVQQDAFSGYVIAYCCGTVSTNYQFNRMP